MKLVRSVFCSFLLFLFFYGCAGTGIPKSPHELPSENISFEMPQPQRWKLENGLEVLFFYDDEVPQISGTLYLPGGSLYDDSRIVGLAGAVGKQMREGGLKDVPPARLDKRLDDLAATIESSFGDEYGTVSFFSLTEDFPEVFSLFSEVVRAPHFDPSRLALWKSLAAEGVKRRRDNAETVSSMTFLRLLYGEDSAYASFRSLESISAITREEMKRFHAKFVQPEGAMLAVSGALPKELVKTAIEREFGDWRGPGMPELALPELTSKPRPAVYLIERDFDQATVAIGHLGPPRVTPDMYQMAVFNRAFGYGGFGSVLFQNIRTRLGLAYSVWGGIAPGVKAGQFQVGMQTRVEQVGKAIAEALRLTEQATVELPGEQVFSQAKSGAERSFLFRFADPASIVDRVALMKILGYPEDYDKRYVPQIQSVSREDVLQTAKRWLHPEQLVVVVVGRITPEELRAQIGEGPEIVSLSFDTEPRLPEGIFSPLDGFPLDSSEGKVGEHEIRD